MSKIGDTIRAGYNQFPEITVRRAAVMVGVGAAVATAAMAYYVPNMLEGRKFHERMITSPEEMINSLWGMITSPWISFHLGYALRGSRKEAIDFVAGWLVLLGVSQFMNLWLATREYSRA